MPRYKVYAIATASWLMGTYTAKDEHHAKLIAEADDQAIQATLCHQCSGVVEINEYYKTDVVETDDG